MTDPSRHVASQLVAAVPQRVYGALVSRDALAAWLAPEGATASIDDFDPSVGGEFRMTLTFVTDTGKSGANRDVIDATFAELVPAERVTWLIRFRSDQPEFAGTMVMTWKLEPRPQGTLVTCIANDVPSGIAQHDHEAGMASTLRNLADHLGRTSHEADQPSPKPAASNRQ